MEQQIESNKAIERAIKDLLAQIVEGKQSVNAEDAYNYTALHRIADYRGQDQLPDILELRSFKDALLLPLNSASARAIAKLLLASGADVDRRNFQDETPLEMAVMSDNSMIASILLEYGANPNHKNQDDETPLYHAKSARMAELLLANGAFVNPDHESDYTPLANAVQNGRFEVVPILLDHGADVNHTDCGLKTPLHLGWFERTAELLLTNGAIVDARDREGLTPLHEASRHGHDDLVRVLVRFGAEVNAKDNKGRTALHHIIGSERPMWKTETIRLLIRLGIDVNAEDDEGRTAIQHAAKSEDALALANQPVEFFLPTARHRGDKVDLYGGISTLFGRLIVTGIELKAAGLSWTQSNLESLELTDNSYISVMTDRNRYSDIGEIDNKFKRNSHAEVEKLKNHMLAESISLHAFMLADNVHYVSNRALLDAAKLIDYANYLTYGCFLRTKFEKLELMVSAMKSFNVLLESSGNKESLPEEVVAKILVHLNSVALWNLISCSKSVMREQYMKTGSREAARLDKAGARRINQ